jgi:hypothetical protein
MSALDMETNMRVSRTFLIGGIAAAALAGVATAAALNTHTLTVRLPDGEVERIVYTGNVAPRVEVAPAGAPVPVVWAPGPGFDDTAFAAMDGISAQMDREIAAMFQQADAMEARALAGSGDLRSVSTADMPAGARNFSYVSTVSGDGICSRSVEITSSGDGRTPRVVRHSSGNCGTSAAPGMSRSMDVAPAETPDQKGLIKTTYHPTFRNSSGNGPA